MPSNRTTKFKTWFRSKAFAATRPITQPVVMIGMMIKVVKITATYSLGLYETTTSKDLFNKRIVILTAQS